MNQFTMRILNRNDPAEIEAYEKALYSAFSKVVDSSLELIWDIDTKKKRIKTRIPYDYQQIMVACIGEVIVGGSALNLNMNAKLQLEEFGFEIDKSEEGICEALLLFNNHMTLDSQILLPQFKNSLLEYLHSKNIKKVYGTCSQRRIRSYRFLGFLDVDQRTVNNQKEYLLVVNTPDLMQIR